MSRNTITPVITELFQPGVCHWRQLHQRHTTAECLVEANRIGFMSINPSGRTVGTVVLIIKQHDLWERPGLEPCVYGGMTARYMGQGISQLHSTVNSNNKIVNNLVYGNGQGDICDAGWYGNDTCRPVAYDISYQQLSVHTLVPGRVLPLSTAIRSL
jgi:hypothetical protein